MEIPKANNLWVPYATLIFAFLLGTFVLPGWMVYVAPEWVLLVLIYWVLAIPYRFGIFSALFIGLVVDVHRGLPLGLNGLAFAVVAFSALALHQRIRIYPPVQQAGMVLLLVGIYLLLKQTLRSMMGIGVGPGVLYLAPALSSALLWPVIYLTLRSLRIRYRVR
ncbi:rod shape-determining protein MreD [Natronospirillum operosum]|uniref:rod shape-determining protein MreD n=1 Tax=Natronospirillum operosum TaxID=2759953 RepID=UPI00143683F1|nr:rod shape-determining protein MreD [Natronospirillum operosum]